MVQSFNPRAEPTYIGTSGDAKPTDSTVTVGALFFETDTQNYYIYDGTTWDAAEPDVGSSITVASSALPANAAKETGGNLAAAKADLDSLVADLGANSALNITDTADHIVKGSAGTFVGVVLNTAHALSTLKVYDGTTAGGTLLATIDGTGVTVNPFEYNIAVSTGIFAKATGSADWTITYK